jgi:outer membrane cobalamin receptor
LKKGSTILILLLILSTGKASAVFDTILIKEVSITAQRALEERGVSFSVIDTSVLHSHLTGSLSDLLISNSTVFMKTYGQGALSTISFRGTSATHTKVKWNGIPLNNPMLGQVDFSLIPVNFTDRISLLHGGSSLQDGAGALGGSIHLESSPAWNDSHSIYLMQGVGSFGTYRSHLNIQLGKKKVRWRMKLFHEQAENDFEYINSENGRWNSEVQENADYKKYGLLGEVFIKPNSRNIISLHTWVQNSNRNIPRIMSFDGIGRSETQKDDQIRLSGIWKNYGQKYKSELTIGYISSGIDYYLANQTGMGLFVNYNSASKAQNAITSYKLSYNIGPKMVLKSLLNYNYSTAHITEKERSAGYAADRQEMGLGLSLHRELSQYITMFGLLRAEVSDQEILPLMPSLGVETDIPVFNLKVISNLSRNYSLPSLNDLYWIPGGNPDLSPEEGYTGDLSIIHSMRKNETLEMTTTLTGFASAINDWIVWQPGEYSYWTAENIASVFARGLEYSVSGQYTTGEISHSLFGTYSFTRTTNRAPIYENDLSVDQQLIYIPVHKANASLTTRYMGYYVMSTFSYIGERFTTSSNEETRHTLPGFMLFDLRTGKEFSYKKIKSSIQIKINNLFNRDYKAILSRPMPGRSWELVLKIEI